MEHIKTLHNNEMFSCNKNEMDRCCYSKKQTFFTKYNQKRKTLDDQYTENITDTAERFF